jgi:hypothetical protein
MMMATSPRVEIFLRRFAALSDGERRLLQGSAEFEYLMVRLKFRSDEPVPPELLYLAIELEARYPFPLDFYRERAEKARRRRSLTERLAASVPYVISVGALR